MEETEQNYGKKLDYDPEWHGPLYIIRTRTDTKFLVSLVIYVVVWFAIAVYAYSSGNGLNEYHTEYHSFGKREIGIHTFDGLNVDSGFSYNRDDNLSISYNRSKRQTKNNIFDNIDSNIIFGFSLFAGVLCVSYIVLLRWFTKQIVYFAIFCICASIFAVICFCAYIYALNNESVMMYLLILSIIIFIVTVLFFMFFRKKINIACEVIKEGCKVILFFPSSLFYPVFPFFLYFLVTMYTGTVYLYLSTIYYNQDTPAHIRVFHFINIFGYLWLIGFVAAFKQMTLSGSFATWYWSRDKSQVPSFTLLKFTRIVSKYHLGTLAFGSLILAICQFIRMLLNSISNSLKGRANCLACLCFCWYKYLFKNIERLVNYINFNAYVMSAVHGTDFWQSAKDAFNLLMRNILSVLVLNKVTNAILFLGQLIVIGLSVAATYGYYYNAKLVEYDKMYTAMVVVGIIAFFMTVSFFMVLKISIDTLFLCSLEDFERNDGSEEKQYYMTFKLRQLLYEQSI